jgi:hypothetical protein
MGKAVVDLRRTDLPDGTRVQVGALMGEVEVQVPPGTNVHLTGLSVMGDRKVRVAPGNGPHLHVNAQALMGSVNVDRRRRQRGGGRDGRRQRRLGRP